MNRNDLPEIPPTEITRLCRWMVNHCDYDDYDVSSAAAYPDREKSRLAYVAMLKAIYERERQ